MSGKLFSVITVVFNDCDNIEQTLNSVLRQRNDLFQYIVIDGGSTDGTLKVIEEYKNFIDIVVSETDSGLYYAMNKGLCLAEGEYICFLNSGDVFIEKILERIHSDLLFEKIKPDFIYGDTIEKTNTNTLLYKKARGHNKAWYGMFAHHQSMFYSREVINSNNMFFDTKYTIAADYDFTIRFLKMAKKTMVLKYPVCIFSQGGISSIKAYIGLWEQMLIRKDLYSMGYLRIALISLVHVIAISVRRLFPFFYNSLRFNKGGKS